MIALIIIGTLLVSIAIVLMFKPVAPSMLFALVGVWLMDKSGYVHISPAQLLFWLVVAMILLLLNRSSRMKTPAVPKTMQRNLALGALVGTLVAVAVGASATTVALGPVCGVIIALVFFCRANRVTFTPRTLLTLSPVLWPLIVTCSLVGLIGLSS